MAGEALTARGINFSERRAAQTRSNSLQSEANTGHGSLSRSAARLKREQEQKLFHAFHPASRFPSRPRSCSALHAASPKPAENPEAAPGRRLCRRSNTGFEVVPGKDPNGWFFIIEPYLWGLGVDGTVGVKRFDSHVDYNPLIVVKHLDWGIMAEGEVGKGSGASSATDFSPSSRQAAILPGRFTTTRILNFSREWWSPRLPNYRRPTRLRRYLRGGAITTSELMLTRALTIPAFGT